MADIDVAVVEIDRVADEGLIVDSRLVDARAVRRRSGTNVALQTRTSNSRTRMNDTRIASIERIHTRTGMNRRWPRTSGSRLCANVRTTERRRVIKGRLLTATCGLM
jgi:hypothetical protein